MSGVAYFGRDGHKIYFTDEPEQAEFVSVKDFTRLREEIGHILRERDATFAEMVRQRDERDRRIAELEADNAAVRDGLEWFFLLHEASAQGDDDDLPDWLVGLREPQAATSGREG